MNRSFVVMMASAVLAVSVNAQQRNSPAMPAMPAIFDTAVEKIRVSTVATGLVNPWSLAFLPNGDMLVTERPGRLRIIRNGVLDPTPIAGTPTPHVAALAGMLEIALHPRFAENNVVYLTYSKGRPEDKRSTTALARATFDGKALVGLKDIFVANTWSVSNTNYGGRIAFDRAGFLYLTVGERQEQDRAQKPEEHAGKVLRLRDDGTAAPGNPFKPPYLPEIYTTGHRSPQGLAMNPETGELWENEHGPLGGDELNILKPGANYGWPIVTYGTDYDGTKISDLTTRADLESPFMFWMPSIAISGITFYTGDRFPQWKGNVFVGSMFAGRTRATGHLVRITFNKGRPIQREPILTELKQRIRDVRQGPDGLLYVLTDEPAGVLLKIEPAAQAQSPQPSLATPNATGVSMGHLHYRVRDVAANARFWRALGGLPVTGSRLAAPGREILRFQDVLVVLDPGESNGGTEGTVVNHVAFRIPSLAPVEAAGLVPARLAQFPGVSSVMSPENERIELFENSATNLTFTPDGGARDAAAERHNRPLAVPIAFHHVHLYLPDAAAVPQAKAWYGKVFGGIPGKRAQYDATDVPGINLNFSAAPRPVVALKGRMLDHVGFEVVRLRDFCRRLEGMGIVFDEGYAEGRDGIGRARLTDPWGTSIELTEGLQ